MDIDKVKRNIGRLVDQGAVEAEIDRYIELEGLTLEQLNPNGLSQNPNLGVDISTSRTIIDNINQGTTFGFGDEITAGISAVYAMALRPDLFKNQSFSQIYNDVLDMNRDNLKAQQEERPGLSLASQLAGGLTTGVGAAATKTGQTFSNSIRNSGLTGRATKSAFLGAGAGTASGVGTGEGSVGERIEGATDDAVLGSIGGGTFGVASPAIGRGITRSVEKVKRGLLGKHVKQVSEKVDDVIASRVGDAREVRDALSQASDTTILTDIAGDEIKGLTRALARVTGGPKDLITDALNNRSDNATKRVTELLSRNISSVDTYFGNLDDIAAARSAAASPLYKQAYKEAAEIKDPRLSKLLEDKRIIDAIEKGKRNLGVRVEAGARSLETLDGAKKALDDVIGKAKRSGENQLAGSYSILKKQLVDVLDDASPTYKQARKVFSDQSALIDAQEIGRTFDRQSKEQVRRTVQEFTPGELDAYKIGVREVLQRKVDNTSIGVDPAKRIFGNSAQREKIREIFTSKSDFEQFSSRLKDEILAADTKAKVLGGSRTDINLADDGGALVEAARKTADEGIKAQIIEAVITGVRNRYAGINKRNAKQLAEILVDKEKSIEALNRIIARESGAVQKRILGLAKEDLPQIINFSAATSTPAALSIAGAN